MGFLQVTVDIASTPFLESFVVPCKDWDNPALTEGATPVYYSTGVEPFGRAEPPFPESFLFVLSHEEEDETLSVHDDLAMSPQASGDTHAVIPPHQIGRLLLQGSRPQQMSHFLALTHRERPDPTRNNDGFRGLSPPFVLLHPLTGRVQGIQCMAPLVT